MIDVMFFSLKDDLYSRLFFIITADLEWKNKSQQEANSKVSGDFSHFVRNREHKFAYNTNKQQTCDSLPEQFNRIPHSLESYGIVQVVSRTFAAC